MSDDLVNEATSPEPTIADDPQMLVAAAINDVIELARAMSAKGLDRGVVEMRRRLKVMDQAMAVAEKAGTLEDGGTAETVQ